MNLEYVPSWQQLQQQLQAPVPASQQQHDCRQCRTALPLFVSDELAGRPVDTRYPEVAYHLDTCPECLAEYKILSILIDTTSDASEVSE